MYSVSDIAGPYSSLKILHHPERIAQLRRGEQIVPTHLEMVLSDLCNHDCSWCLAGDTLIDTPNGQRRIDSMLIGDEVNTPLGGKGRVTDCGSREVSEILEVITDGKRLLVTGEHPILTQDGYKRADEVQVGRDSAALRVWLRKHSDDQSENENIQQATKGTLLASENRLSLQAFPNTKGLSSCAGMPMRVRRRGSGVPENAMVGLHQGPRHVGVVGAVRGDSRENVSKHDNKQSDAASGRCCQSEREDEGQGTESLQGRSAAHCRCGAQENALGQESNEECRVTPQGHGEGVCASRSVKKRDALRGVVQGSRPGTGLDWQCETVGGEEESRFQDSETEKGYRSNAKGDIHEQAKHQDNGELRHSGCETVSAQEVELPCGFQEGPSQCDSAAIGSGDEVLHGEVGALERGLVLRPIASVRRLLGQFRVYNLSIEPFESYIANGIVVHNCAYRWTGYTSNELFAKDVPLAQFGTNNPMRMMRKEKAIEIIDDMVEMGIGALECTGGGEPTVHPDCVDIMKYALDKGLDVALVSNGELFRPGHIENLLRCKWVRFSLDAATPEVYAANRRIKGERMHRVTANIKALTDARKQYIASGSKCDLIVGVGFVLNKDNWWEAAACARLAKSLGADNIRISAVFQPDDDSYFADFYEGALAQCKEARQLEGDGFRVFDNFGDRYQDLVDKNPTHSFCGYQQFTTYVGADESNFRCCLLAYSERGTIGSLKNQRLKDLWASDAKREDFEKFDATQCERCMFGGKLRTILYAIDPNPQHANFV